MNLRMIAAAALTTLALGGCSGPVSAPPGTSQYQVDNDVATCRFEASRGHDGVAWPDDVKMCLRGKGYR